jgi:hypothetical protein
MSDISRGADRLNKVKWTAKADEVANKLIVSLDAQIIMFHTSATTGRSK